MSKTIAFQKWEATGNDFLFIDQESQGVLAQDLPLSAVVEACHREKGFGADGVILYSRSNSRQASMTVINSDGSRGDMCGNALRCLAHILKQQSGQQSHQVKLTSRSVEVSSSDAHQAAVVMGRVAAVGEQPFMVSVDAFNAVVAAKGYLCSFGNPHYVVPVPKIPSDWEKLGAALQSPAHQYLGTHGINCGFLETESRSGARRLRVFERGAGPTKSCGSGACAASAVLQHLGLSSPPHILDLPGGRLTIERRDEAFILKGEARLEYVGEWKLEI